MRPRSRWSHVFVLVLAGCSTTPGDEYRADLGPPARGPVEVEILDAWFVQVDGARVARDEFVFRMRTDCRRWRAEKLAAPEVHVRWEDGVEHHRVTELAEQLRIAGVRHVRVGP